MKAYKHIMKSALALGAFALAATSCQDWLTVYPQTQVVEENFWEDKNDLEGVRYAAYKQMCSTIEKLGNWGELRSDNFDLWNTSSMSTSSYITASQEFEEIRLGRLEKDSANTYFDYSSIYTTINYCNKVLQHGEEVLAKDAQFTTSEWRQMKAEMVALRALNYFYLIRSFKDVPYTTTVVNSDEEVQSFGATNQLVILDSLIYDVEEVAGQARNRFTDTDDTKGLITNSAIYALLSDMYLWRASLHQGRDLLTDTLTIQQTGSQVTHTCAGDYQLAADYADLSMASLADQLENQNQQYGTSRSYEMLSYGLTNVNLIKNTFDGFCDGTTSTSMTYSQNAIFSSGNSDESIFELQFNSSDSRKNSYVTDYFGSNADHYLATNENSLQTAFGAGGSTCFDRDARMWVSAQTQVNSSSSDLSQRCIFKWTSAYAYSASTSISGSSVGISTTSSEYCNWIIYRLSDVMLQKAEALVCMDALTGSTSHLTEAMQLVHAIHRRSYCNDNYSGAYNVQPSEDVTTVTYTDWGVANATSSNMNVFGNLPQPSSVQSSTYLTEYEVAVLNERQIEFIAEGKRWFDLVRFAERHAGGQDGTEDPREYTEETPIGSGQTGVELMVDQFLGNAFNSSTAETLKTRFKNRYGLYNLIYYMEIKASDGMLEQNPVWNKSTYDL